MNFVDFLKEKNIPYRLHGQHHHTTQGFVQLDCPFCSKNSGKFRLGFNLWHGFFTCWTCGYLSRSRTLTELGLQESIGKLVYDKIKTEKIPGRLRYPASAQTLSQHETFLRKRGFDPIEVKRLWEISYIGLSSKYSWSILIPIYWNDQVVSYTTRSIAPDGKYMNAKPQDEAYPAKKLLYGEDYARNSIVVCEGPLDVWAVGPGAVATLGIAFTRTQVARIAKYPKRVICFDAEPQAQKQAQKLCSTLQLLEGETINVVLETGKDPSRASKEEVQRLREYLA